MLLGFWQGCWKAASPCSGPLGLSAPAGAAAGGRAAVLAAGSEPAQGVSPPLPQPLWLARRMAELERWWLSPPAQHGSPALARPVSAAHATRSQMFSATSSAAFLISLLIQQIQEVQK